MCAAIHGQKLFVDTFFLLNTSTLPFKLVMYLVRGVSQNKHKEREK